MLIYMEKLHKDKAKKTAYLTKDNEADWTKDVGVYRDFYLYNCTNSQ